LRLEKTVLRLEIQSELSSALRPSYWKDVMQKCRIMKKTSLCDKANIFTLRSTSLSKKREYAALTARSDILVVLLPLLNVDIKAMNFTEGVVSFEISGAFKKSKFYHLLCALSYGTETVIIIIAAYHLVDKGRENSGWQLSGCHAFGAKTRQ